jgi:hypothetical protein
LMFDLPVLLATILVVVAHRIGLHRFMPLSCIIITFDCGIVALCAYAC